MRVGLVCPYDLGVPGGVQQIVLDLARQLTELGDDVVVVGPGAPPPDSQLDSISVGSSVTISANESRAPICLSPAAWTRTLEAVSGRQVIHIHEPFMPVVGWAALSLRSHPTVVTFHADPPRWTRRAYGAAAFLGQFGLRRVVTTAVSPVAAAAVPRMWRTPRVIPNAVDVASFDVPVTRRPARVAFLGRDEPRKGLDLLLESWKEVVTVRPGAELLVMGTSRGEAPAGVRFLGRVDGDEKRRVLASSAVYVAPNTGGESFGLVVAEGMAAGCAVVASDLPAFADVLGDAGILFPAGDVDSLAASLTDLLAEPDRAVELGRLARQRARRFDWSEVVGLYRDTYREALR